MRSIGINFSAGFNSGWEHFDSLHSFSVNTMRVPAIIKDKYTAFAFAAAAAILVIGFSIFHVNLWDSKDILVIHFDKFKGVDFFGDTSDVLDILITAAFVWLINIVLANKFYFRERFLSYLLAFSTLLFIILILIGVNVIISVN